MALKMLRRSLTDFHIIFKTLQNGEKKTKGVFKILSNIYDEAFFRNSLRLKAVNYFRKNARSWMFDWVLNTPLKIPS